MPRTRSRAWLARWPLRLRVALAFLVTTAAALVGLGVFVQVRVADTLDERLRDVLEAEADRLVAVPPGRRDAEVESLAGEEYAELVDREGRVIASSAQIPGRLLEGTLADVLADGDASYVEADVTVRDDESDDTETEPALLLVRPLDDGTLVVGTSRDDTEEAAAEVRDQLLVGGPVALAVAGVLGYLVAGAGLRPIERMRARAATISDRSAGERLPIPVARDELRRLAETLNAMLDRLDDGLQRQRRFVADASHELRTPLALLRTEIELALSRPRTPEELTAALRSAEEETRRLIALAEDLLVLAAADADGLMLDLQTVDLADIAREVVARFSGAAGAERRSVTVTASDRHLVTGDPERLDQVVSNLVDNALRHGAGDVEVGLAGGGASTTLEIADDGPGFGEQRPFDRFAGSGGSTGLGLAIVREIVHAHGGSVTIGRDAGHTVVRIELPYAWRPGRITPDGSSNHP